MAGQLDSLARKSTVERRSFTPRVRTRRAGLCVHTVKGVRGAVSAGPLTYLGGPR